VPLAPAEFDAHVRAEIGTTGVRALMGNEAPIRLSAISEGAKIDDRDLIESARSSS
jgi:hypothetical protein